MSGARHVIDDLIDSDPDVVDTTQTKRAVPPERFARLDCHGSSDAPNSPHPINRGRRRR
jgi:hypothetical protein